MKKGISKFQEKLIADGYCDSRGAGFCATATYLPFGKQGLVALCVKDNNLDIYDVDIRSNIGELLYTVILSDIENLKIKSGIFSQVLQFEYKYVRFSFTNFVGVKPALNVIEAEAKRNRA